MKKLSELNSYSAESVTFTDEHWGPGQILADRYQINGLIDTSNPVLENIEALCSAAGSWLSYDIHEGRWGVVINKSETSIASFDDSNILGSISLSGTGLTDLYNQVKTEFPHRELRDSKDFITIEIPDGDRNANEPDNVLNINYNILNEPVQASLLGFIELKQSRIDLVIQFQTDFSHVGLKAGDVIDVTNTRFNFTNKLFRIVTVKEVQDDDGPFTVDIVAIEYDEGVYSTSDLYRYTRTDENGIITIGSIGLPGTPQVSKVEVDARPRVIIESTAPTGVVEGLEFWISTDVTEADDANRSYSLIATKKPVGGGIYTSGETVTLDYDQIGATNFLVKTRGFNSTTTGPYSNPSGFVYFAPTQVTNAIDDNTTAIGGLLGALTLLDLIKKVDGVFTDKTGEGSLYKKIGELVKTVTGSDVFGVDDMSGPPLVTSVTPSSGRIDGGTEVTISGKRFLDIQDVTFGGTSAESFTVSNSTTILAVTPPHAAGFASVLVTNSSGTNASNTLYFYSTQPLPVPIITSITPSQGPISGGTLVNIVGYNFDGATSVTFNGDPGTSLNVVSSSTIEVITPPSVAGAATVVVTTPNGSGSGTFTYEGADCNIAYVAKYPPDRTTYQDPLTGLTSDKAPINGSYYLVFGGQNIYNGLVRGNSGEAKLYKSDGTLVQTLTAADLTIDNNVVGFPFSTRELGTDYYVLVDEGMVKYCGCANPAMQLPNLWNFNTPPYSTPEYTVASTPQPLPDMPPLYDHMLPANNKPICKTDVTVYFTTQIIKGAGNAYVKSSANDATIKTVSVNDCTLVDGNGIILPIGEDIQYSGSYYITADAGFIKSYEVLDCFTVSTDSPAYTKATGISFTVTPVLNVIQTLVDSTPLNDPTKVNPQTNVGLRFNSDITFTETGTITIYTAGGQVHQAIPITTNFNQNKTNELIWISNSTNSEVNPIHDVLWINPTKDFTLGETYYIQATPTCVQDDCGQGWAGINDTTTVRFRVDPGPVAQATPINPYSETVTLAYDRPIDSGTGNLVIYDENNNVVKTVSSTGNGISYS